MATQTSALKLIKPARTDNVDINVLNTNMDRVDKWALGNPSAILNLQARLNKIESTWEEATATTSVTLGSGGSAKIWTKQYGKIVTGRFYLKIGSNGSVPQPIRFILPVKPNDKYYDNATQAIYDNVGSFTARIGGTQLLVGSVHTYGNFFNGVWTSPQIGLMGAATQNVSTGSFARELGAGSEPWNTKWPNSWFSGIFEYETD